MAVAKKILLLGEYGTLNGGENSFLAIAPDLAMLGCNFSAATIVPSDFQKQLTGIGIPCFELELHGPDGVRKQIQDIQNHVSEIVSRIQPDIVHCNSLSTSRIYGSVAPQIGIPSIGYLRDIIRISAKATRDVNGLDRIVAVSAATKKWHVEQGILENKIRVIHNGVDSSLFSPDQPQDDQLETELQKLGIPTGSPLLLSVGQIGMRKGLDVLLKSFESIITKVPECYLMIVGERHSQKSEAIEYETELRRVAKAINRKFKTKAVSWLGRRRDIPALMRRANVLVHTARQEPLGRVLLEAAASGLPIVATDAGGTNEIIEQDWIAPIDDDARISALVQQLLNDSTLAIDVSRQLRRTALSKFSKSKCAVNLDQEYNVLLNGRL